MSRMVSTQGASEPMTSTVLPVMSRWSAAWLIRLTASGYLA